MTRVAAAAVLAALALASRLLEGQEASVFLGGTRARYADSVSSTGGAVVLRFGTGPGLRTAQLEGAYLRFTDGDWAAQIAGRGTALWRLGGLWTGFAAAGSMNAFEAGTPTGVAAGGPLFVVPAGRSYVTASVAGGAARRLDSAWIPLGTASARWQIVPAPGALTVGLGAAATTADTLRFADVSVGLSVSGRRARAAAVVGVRAGDLADGAWGSLEAEWTPHPRVAFEVTAGRYPPDLTGFTDGLYAQAGVRLFAAGGGRPPAPAVRGPPAVRAERTGDGRVRLRVRLGREAGEVAIAGDWSGWEPVPLTRDGEDWTAWLRLDPGAYKYALLADGEWMLPSGVVGMDDGFGGTVGLLVIGPAGRSGGEPW